MGAWGIGAFENDDALDWLGDFCDEPDEESLKEAFAAVNENGDDYLESPESSNALIAAEVVAYLLKSLNPEVPKHSIECLESLQVKPDETLISDAIKAVERVQSDSELKELWEDTDDFQEWSKTVDDLISRLKK